MQVVVWSNQVCSVWSEAFSWKFWWGWYAKLLIVWLSWTLLIIILHCWPSAPKGMHLFRIYLSGVIMNFICAMKLMILRCIHSQKASGWFTCPFSFSYNIMLTGRPEELPWIIKPKGWDEKDTTTTKWKYKDLNYWCILITKHCYMHCLWVQQ